MIYFPDLEDKFQLRLGNANGLKQFLARHFDQLYYEVRVEASAFELEALVSDILVDVSTCWFKPMSGGAVAVSDFWFESPVAKDRGLVVCDSHRPMLGKRDHMIMWATIALGTRLWSFHNRRNRTFSEYPAEIVTDADTAAA